MILCDTGPLVAAFNAADRDHTRCTAFLRENWSRLVVPSLAVTEICHLLPDPQRRGRTELAAEFCAAVAADVLPPRKHGLLIPGSQAHAMKLGFEKYFLWKARHGYVSLP
jgi:predicted nucleic acid-binding protein